MTDITTMRSEHDPMPPDFIRPDMRRRRNGAAVDQEAMLRAIQGGVPAEVAAYAPKPKPTVDLAGQFAEQVRPLVEVITAEIDQQATALERQAAALRNHGAGIVSAIIDNARFAAEQMTTAKARAEAAAALHSDLAGKSATLGMVNPAANGGATAAPEAAHSDGGRSIRMAMQELHAEASGPAGQEDDEA